MKINVVGGSGKKCENNMKKKYIYTYLLLCSKTEKERK